MTDILPLAGEKQKGESYRAIQACNDYLRMGPGRSLVDLHRRYTQDDTDTQNEPPTRGYTTLRNWSSRYNWSERAESWDADAETRKDAEYEAAMRAGLALEHNRVKALRRLANFLGAQIYEQSESGDHYNVWLPDVKQIGSGEDVERVDIVRFNSGLLQQYRATLDDIAQETGGRTQTSRHEIKGELGVNIYLPDNGRDQAK